MIEDRPTKAAVCTVSSALKSRRGARVNTRVIRYGKVSRVRLMYISLMKTDEKRPLWCPVTQELSESRRQ